MKNEPTYSLSLPLTHKQWSLMREALDAFSSGLRVQARYAGGQSRAGKALSDKARDTDALAWDLIDAKRIAENEAP